MYNPSSSPAGPTSYYIWNGKLLSLMKLSIQIVLFLIIDFYTMMVNKWQSRFFKNIFIITPSLIRSILDYRLIS